MIFIRDLQYSMEYEVRESTDDISPVAVVKRAVRRRIAVITELVTASVVVAVIAVIHSALLWINVNG